MARQTAMTAMLPPKETARIKELDKQAAKYREARDIRMQCSAAEVMEKRALHALMAAHRDELPTNEEGETVYPLYDAEPPEEIALVTSDEDVKVRKSTTAPKKKAKDEPPASVESDAEPPAEDVTVK